MHLTLRRLLTISAAAAAVGLAGCGSGSPAPATVTTVIVEQTTAAAPAAAASITAQTLAESIRATFQRNADEATRSGKATGTLEIRSVTCDPIIDDETTCNIGFFSPDGFSPGNSYLTGGRVTASLTGRRWTVAALDRTTGEKPVHGSIDN